jgi:hypothetical protein
MDNEGLITRLRKRANIRRSIPRGEPDRISDILEEAADMIECLRDDLEVLRKQEPIGIITDRVIDRGIEWESNFYRYVVIAGTGDCNLYAEPKPAQEKLTELIAWANLPRVGPELIASSSKGEWRSDGYNSAREYVKSQLDKMKGGV